MANIPVILLAAGGSTRMGSPKQLLAWGDKTLIEHQIETVLKIGNPVNVVLGANTNLVRPVVERYNINIFINDHWQDGMGSSIAVGVKGLTHKFSTADGLLIALLDQPLIQLEHFRKILDVFQPEKKQIIVSVAASGWKGVPVLFDKFYFDELQNINGSEGAKKMIRTYGKKVKYVTCDCSLEDMDTPEDYKKMLVKFFGKS